MANVAHSNGGKSEVGGEGHFVCERREQAPSAALIMVATPL